MQQQQMQQQQMQQQQPYQINETLKILQSKIVTLEKKLKNNDTNELQKKNDIIRKLMNQIKILKEKDEKNKLENEKKILESKKIIDKLNNEVKLKEKDLNGKTTKEIFNLIKQKYDNIRKNKEFYENKIKELDEREKNIENNENDIEDRIKEISIKERDIESLKETINLKLKNRELEEIEFDKKSNILDKILEKYKNELEKKYLQIEISSDDKSEYDFNFSNVNNISLIKLISYSLPNNIYNINNNNNELIINFENDDNVVIKIKPGKYNINNLINNINDKLENIQLSLTDTQNIKITSEKPFRLVKTNLSYNNLGFKKYNEEFEKNLLSDHIWDLRLPDKLYLFIDNINNNIPFGILYFNKIIQSEIKFDDPINLNNFHIRICDKNKNLYDFNNLKHTLNFQLEVVNKLTNNINEIYLTE